MSEMSRTVNWLGYETTFHRVTVGGRHFLVRVKPVGVGYDMNDEKKRTILVYEPDEKRDFPDSNGELERGMYNLVAKDTRWGFKIDAYKHVSELLDEAVCRTEFDAEEEQESHDRIETALLAVKEVHEEL